MIQLCNGGARAVIRPEFGGRVVSLEFNGYEYLADGGRLEGDPWRGGSYPLAPWAGTLREPWIHSGGHRIHVPPCSDGSTKHGYVRSMAWDVTHLRETRVELSCEVGGMGPWSGRCSQTIDLEPDRLRIRLEYSATGEVPVALGLHPWFSREPDGSGPRLTFTPERKITTNDDGIETETAQIAAGPRDDLYRADGGTPRIEWRDGRQIEVHSDAQVWVIYERDALGLCVEPWSHTPAEFSMGKAPSASVSPAKLVMELVTLT